MSMTNLTHAFTFRKAPVFAAVLAIASAQTGTSAETTKVDTKSQKTERPTRSPQVALQQQSQTKLRVRGGKMETRMQDGKLSGTMSCTGGEMPGEMVTTMKGDYGSQSYDMTMDMETTGLPGVALKITARTQGRRVGDCA